MAAQSHDPAHSSKLALQGLTQAEVQEAINAYAKHVELRVHMRAQLREAVDHAYMDDLPLVSEATQKQAKRTANARVRLIQDEGEQPPITALPECAGPGREAPGRGSIDSDETISSSPWRSTARLSSPWFS